MQQHGIRSMIISLIRGKKSFLRNWKLIFFLRIEAKRTLLIQELKMIKKKRPLLIPDTRKISSHIGGRSYRCFVTAAALFARTCVITLDCTHWPLHLGGRGLIRSCRHLTAAALLSRSDVIRIVFSLLMSPSLVCWIGLTAVRKKAARVPLRRGLNCESSEAKWTFW